MENRGGLVNFGGFVGLSTVDWPGRSVCTIFLRGCPLRCSYCHNLSIQTGQDFLDIDSVMEMVESAAPLISGAVISGGEPTLQAGAVLELARRIKGLGLAVGLQTNGYFPATLERLLSERLLDRVALDYKTRWEGYSGRREGYDAVCTEDYTLQVRRSIELCTGAWDQAVLPEFEVVLTIFPGNEADAIVIAKRLPPGIPLVLNQGVMKRSWENRMPGTNGTRPPTPGDIEGWQRPLTLAELKGLADQISRKRGITKIRTREEGEKVYESDRGRWAAGERKR
ncbi:pyruvate formate lyase activating enzyme [Methanolinea mesophila]|uniref:anaerobic ribonucleoside-triphosphate reductase activating protein n=1 Tax=Methanolinea mesophila TaxID=547055 RepID=UPI001AE30419|nr:anaerobic ribonucleoside-triphosphate reductase activating protein [Methanolinea mesophila]MBP1928273.1 pyruvate formate lyase activating enzyme [Methanolinea mesophila]